MLFQIKSHQLTFLVNHFSSSICFPPQSTFLFNQISLSIYSPCQSTFLINQLSSSINFPCQSTFVVTQLSLSCAWLILQFFKILVLFPRPRRSSDYNYVSIENDPSIHCHSFWGFEGHGKHKINLLPDWGGEGYCTSRYVVVHEFLHGFGLWHEQQRPDRDDYIWLDENNMDSDHCETYNVPYDHKSIMHYGASSWC